MTYRLAVIGQLFFLILCSLPFSARAGSIPFTGTAEFESAVQATFSITGPNLMLFSTTVDWTSPLFVCTQSTPCNLTMSLPTGYGYLGIPPPLGVNEMSGSLDGRAANVLVGSLLLTVTQPPPFPGGADTPFDFTSPVTLSGDIVGYDPMGCTGALLSSCDFAGEVFDLALTASGTLTMSAEGGPGFDVFENAQYTFAGTASPVPEPASFLLLSTGLALLIYWTLRCKGDAMSSDSLLK